MPAPQPAAIIERMVLQLPGGSAARGREMARLVAVGLAAAGALPQAGDIPTLRATIRAEPREDDAAIARRIVGAIVRDLARTP